MKDNKGKNGLKWLIYLIFGGFLVKFIRFCFKGDNEKKIGRNFKNFFRKEKKEVKQLAEGKESFKKYIKDSCSIFTDYFIPSDCNDNKPKILRTKPLLIIVIALLLLKMSVSGYLFFIYPNIAKMTQKIQDEVYNLVNTERQSNNIAVLSSNDKLNEVARAKAEDMINNNYFAHKTLDGKMIWDLIDRNEYAYLYVGENLAMNFTTSQSAHKALMLSPTHKKNILNSKYSEIGIAVVAGEIDNKKTNVLVQVFAHAKVVKPVLAQADIEPALPVVVLDEPVIEEVQPEKVVENIVEPINEPVPIEPEVLSEDLPVNDLENVKVIPIQKEEIVESPNEEMEEYALASIYEVDIEIKNKYGAAARAINYSQYIFIGALILLVLLLLVNILVRVSVQHKPVIVQTLLVIIFVYGLMNVKFHFLENIVENILIM